MGLTVYECIDKPLIANIGEEIESGFGGIVTPIGLVIIFGTQIGKTLEISGAKTAQLRSTATLFITFPIVRPLLPSLGLNARLGTVPIWKILMVRAIGSVAMVVNHVNATYFGGVPHFYTMNLTTAYRVQKLVKLVKGIVVVAFLGLILM
ncbi:hypothetical protein [Brevibacillus porteri]|uniref:hypothetical protein n=1 Tax=Brevibacillus porteri TaxID=2126350 RepID=UPI003635761B